MGLFHKAEDYDAFEDGKWNAISTRMQAPEGCPARASRIPGKAVDHDCLMRSCIRRFSV